MKSVSDCRTQQLFTHNPHTAALSLRTGSVSKDPNRTFQKVAAVFNDTVILNTTTLQNCILSALFIMSVSHYCLALCFFPAVAANFNVALFELTGTFTQSSGVRK
jgi:hypothetical protein